MIDPNNPDAKALVKAIDAAAEKLGPLTTAQLLEQQLQEVRRLAQGGEYPRALYGKNGQVKTVLSKSEEDEAGSDWSRTPTGDHRKAPNTGAVVATEEAMTAELAVRRANANISPTDSRNVVAGPPEKITSDTTTVAPAALVPGTAINNQTMPGVVPSATVPAPKKGA